MTPVLQERTAKNKNEMKRNQLCRKTFLFGLDIHI